MQIKNITAREILDSRGNPTVEAEIYLQDNSYGRASVPSGASTGSKEAHELRDLDINRYFGKGVLTAVDNIKNILAPDLISQKFLSQQEFDTALINIDHSKNKSRLGANSILALSLAFARAKANYLKAPLFETIMDPNKISDKFYQPLPLMNILNGGAHANNNLDIQEFMIIPIGATSIKEALEMGAQVFQTLKKILHSQGYSTAVGDEGGFAPALKSNTHALDLILLAVEKSGLIIKDDIVLALDVAASELYLDKENKYILENKKISAQDLIKYYQIMIKNYPIVSIEDALDENDWDNWRLITHEIGHEIQLVGDDIFVTNPEIITKAIKNDIANAVLIKPNQIGTLTETLEAINIAKASNYSCIMSHRSGETEDAFIADLAVASGCEQIKTGSLCRTDRIAKYNQLLRISEYGNMTINKNQKFKF